MASPAIGPSTGDVLAGAARDGSIVLTEWPDLLEAVISQLYSNVHTAFPLPSARRSIPATSTLETTLQGTPSPDEVLPASHVESASSDTRNNSTAGPSGVPHSTTNGNEPVSPSNVANVNGSGLPSTNAGPSSHAHDSASEIPGETLALYNSCVQTLRNTFARAPPYNLQRLAELILDPRRHYRFLPPYLAALDQVLSVSSTVADFPMPQPQVSAGSTFLTNGEAPPVSTSEGEGLVNDESLGGALLTPIPWLRRDSQGHLIVATHQPTNDAQTHEQSGSQAADGSAELLDDGARQTSHDPSMSTHQSLRAEGAVTQGELLRQEQEAGVVPVAQTRGVQVAMNGLSTTRTDSTPDSHPSEGPIESIESVDHDGPPVEQMPHARGPEVIGMEDTGPQHDTIGAGRPLDIEGAVGRARTQSPRLPDDDGRGQQQQQVSEQGSGQEQAEEGTRGGSKEPSAGGHHEQDQEMTDAV